MYLDASKSTQYPLLSNIKDKVILITGAGGSIGGELVRQVCSLAPKQIILLESNEYALYKISSEINGSFICKLADVRDSLKSRGNYKRI